MMGRARESIAWRGTSFLPTDCLWLLVATMSEGAQLLVTRAGTLNQTGAEADVRP